MLSAAPRVVEGLLPLALEYPDSQARWQIAMILPAALGERAIEPLRRLAQDGDEYVRRRACTALSSMGST
ncbi:HEAT repeat domain-containing protein [Couchioplanes caeruleus]|uniref:HEAT repeat domain-containing protein n=1 Tax=Couchioplanes caeruleus TaxID=56438 RepID=UPI000AF51B90